VRNCRRNQLVCVTGTMVPENNLMHCSSVVNCAREDFGNPWSCATDCYLTECVILRKCGRKKLIDIRLRVLVMNMATRDAKHPSLPACDVPILVCIMLHHLCAYDLLMDPKGSKFNTVQSEGVGGGCTEYD
jgi:hypothetical protein